MDTDTMPTADGLSLQSDAGRALSSPTIVELFREQVVRLAARTALRQPVDGLWQEVSSGQYGDAVREIAAGLIDIGVAPGDRVALLATNSPDWHFADLGILSAAAVTVPVCPTRRGRSSSETGISSSGRNSLRSSRQTSDEGAWHG